MASLIITKKFWLSSELSLARFYGGIKINGHQYDIMPPSDDLVRSDIKDIYQFFGKEQLMDFFSKKLSINQIRLLMMDERKNRSKKQNQELGLF